MALKVAIVHHRQEQAQPLYLEAEITVVRAVKTALSDPRESLRDETILAILCLDSAQRLPGQTPARPHLKGALALVRHRGPKAFDSEVSSRCMWQSGAMYCCILCGRRTKARIRTGSLPFLKSIRETGPWNLRCNTSCSRVFAWKDRFSMNKLAEMSQNTTQAEPEHCAAACSN